MVMEMEMEMERMGITKDGMGWEWNNDWTGTNGENEMHIAHICRYAICRHIIVPL